ncbi:alpha/beta fold hydrolase [Lacibacterium aquatile]|uniref:Alpha/beta fold hydrolase n=1 Tax=Lacibacterium aquatile TaxID=1168082 RepID=A0ABW5DMA4_9PROT
MPILNGQSGNGQDAALKAALEAGGVDPSGFAAAVEVAGRRRMASFLAGVKAYQQHPYRRDLPEPPVLWQEGDIRLLDYAPDAPPGTPVLLAVPSLINRAYILDLMPGRSLMRWLAEVGIRPLLLDWGAPGEACRDFTLTDYVCGPLLDALAVANRLGPVNLLGYCMGGQLALAAAQQPGAEVERLTLLATPWDFHADGDSARRLVAALPGLKATIDWWGGLPVDAIQMLFAGIDLWQINRKFEAFGRIDPANPKAEAFVALEDWLNDGVPLAPSVARECLEGWYGDNSPQQGRWRIAGRPVLPSRCDIPTLAIIPAQDRIVPPQSARALADALPLATTLDVPLGHIGMIVSGAAPKRVWPLVREWVTGGASPV